MFKISAVQDFNEQQSVAAACSAHAKEGFFAYAMRDVETGELMGFSQFEITESGYISDLRGVYGSDDFEAMFILGRTTMSFIEACGITECRAALDAADEILLKAIGFKKDTDFYRCDLSGMFDGSHCTGEAVKLK